MDSRSFPGSISYGGDDKGMEVGDVPKAWPKIPCCYRLVTVSNQALLSGITYCLSSCSMILVNKFVLSGYDFNAGISLLFYQNFIAVLVVSLLCKLRIISIEPLTWRLVRVWLPVNVIFVGMLVTSTFSLKYMNVAMLTVLKNVANVITAIGETYLLKSNMEKKFGVR
ncbi:hypothetical protein HPP92_011586 [Vanilla planifolia]|uniref:GDP-mannose transporter n=1 Tax=Vanilla planifolia TaxID=51239 RepID=A0A835V2Y5_VANPL|nr:hypothetical protein HPP92_011586 [Vanilla planifolia]